MNTQRTLSGVLLAACAVALPLHAQAAEFYLRAEAITVPDPNGGAPIAMWAYAKCTGNGSGCDPATVPGPALVVPAGDPVLTVHLLNTLPQPTSLVINGLSKAMAPVWNDGSTGPRSADLNKRVRSFDTEAPANGTADYTWNSVKPGTYLYQSGTQPQVQVQMGLYGAMTQNAQEAGVAAAQVYPGVAYDNVATLFYSEIDPVLHAAVADGTYGTTGPKSTFDYQPKYFLINGKPYSSTNANVIPHPGNSGTTLIRMLNAGLTTHVPMIGGVHWTLVGEDGKPYPYLTRQYTALLPAAKTLDLLLVPDAGGAVYPIMDRRLNLSNNGAANGGMLAYLQYDASGVPGGGSGTGNLPPVAVADSYSTVAGIGLNVGVTEGVLLNDNNTDGLPQPIRAVSVGGTTTGGGSYTLNSNGSFTYKPAVGYAGATDSFTYSVTDGQAVSATTATVTITLTTPGAPSAGVLDNFNRAASSNLGPDWTQAVSTNPPEPNVQGNGSQATVASVGLGGLAIWNTQTYLAKQGAGFNSSTPLEGSAVVLKASGGTDLAPANYVRVRCDASNLVISTMMSGSNLSIYVTQASFPAPGCGASGSLSAVVDEKGIVTAFLNGGYVGGVQLPDVRAWKGNGKIGVQLQTLGATIDDFFGGSL